MKTTRAALWVVVSMAMFATAQDARPGKGLSFLPGDYAEYSNTEYDGDKKTVTPSTIMISMGAKDELEAVQVLTIKDAKLVSTSTVFFDMQKEKPKLGELLDSGKETLTIDGTKHECTWEKRRVKNVTATFWQKSDLPFERFAKVEMKADDGRKRVTELVAHGPHIPISDKDAAFMKRLNEFKEQKRKDE